MKTKLCMLFLLALLHAGAGAASSGGEGSEPTLKEVAKGKFRIGTAVNDRQISLPDTQACRLIRTQFDAIVAENCMKCQSIHPEEDRFDFRAADRFVRFGEENGMFIVGHCLIWHSQLAPWFCKDEKGQNVSPEVLRQRMKTHIQTIVGRYRGRVKGWDVVNEALMEDGSYRRTPFYEILGEEFIPLAFRYAHEADPDAELYYNDYGMDVPGRRDAVVRLVRKLKGEGIRIDAVGMQGHMGMDYPRIDQFEQSMEAFAAEGVKVMITEWDMSALPFVTRSANIGDTAAYRREIDPYPDGLPLEVSARWNERMRQFFDLFVRHADYVTRVNVWGLTDGDSWKNNFPVAGRHDYPVLFDRNYRPKPFVRSLLEECAAHGATD